MTMPLGADACMTDLLDRLSVSVDSLTDELTAEILNGERSYAEGMLLSHEQYGRPAGGGPTQGCQLLFFRVSLVSWSQ
ncbi:hypothetical protein [Streptomyces olivochromogenes]|uniref:Uncharacterized protein n=1 Tax=Streptomyces olivochromogenes TaxID=1963 RepID=A0A286PHB9_STROL|nr:hypothetical protein [Streptomyces olivochromogenes]KUN37078.1 hypothetical protein AQJ27_46280 [Streptomyces olivochromogenes]GAX58948.1 hypothetical protein SO3561_10523 [Streptomyces olivochromogenes]